MLKLIHLSDLHFQRCDADNKRVVSRLMSIWNEEFLSSEEAYLLLTGDVTDDGHSQQYENVTRAMSMFPQDRVLVCPGNHDYGTSGLLYYPVCAERFDAFACSIGYTRDYRPKLPIVRVLRSPSGQRLMTIGLNSNLETLSPADLAKGEVGSEQRDYLTAILDNPDARDLPKLVYLHHHPFERGFAMALRDTKAFMSTIEGKVQVLCFGHRHKQELLGDRYGIPHIVAAGSIKDAEETKYLCITLDDAGALSAVEKPIL